MVGFISITNSSLILTMEFLTNQFYNVNALTKEVFSAESKVYGPVVIKKVPKSSVEFKSFCSLKHENIVQVYEIIEAEEFAFVIMECAECDVFEYIMNNGLMSMEVALSVFVQILKAIVYCHKNQVAHSDIKLENILLSNGSAKLADFGFAKFSDIVAESQEFCGTLPYAAPEVIQGLEYNPMKADMWAMGVVLYALLFGGFPFSDADASEMVAVQLSNTLFFPENASETLKSLISSMLEPSVEKRADASSVLLALI